MSAVRSRSTARRAVSNPRSRGQAHVSKGGKMFLGMPLKRGDILLQRRTRRRSEFLGFKQEVGTGKRLARLRPLAPGSKAVLVSDATLVANYTRP